MNKLNKIIDQEIDSFYGVSQLTHKPVNVGNDMVRIMYIDEPEADYIRSLTKPYKWLINGRIKIVNDNQLLANKNDNEVITYFNDLLTENKM